MRKAGISFVVGMVVVLGVVLSLGPGGVEAQGDPTPTLNISGLLGRTPPAAGEATQVTAEPTALPAVTEAPGMTPVPTEAGAIAPSGLQLLWLQMDAGFEPVTVDGVTVGGPVDVYAMVGDPCAQNVYAAQLPTFEFHLLSDTDHVRIGFLADDGSATALVMWDPIEQVWWCTIDAGYGSELTFEPLVTGDYPIYVGVQGRQDTITGQLYITEALP